MIRITNSFITDTPRLGLLIIVPSMNSILAAALWDNSLIKVISRLYLSLNWNLNTTSKPAITNLDIVLWNEHCWCRCCTGIKMEIASIQRCLIQVKTSNIVPRQVKMQACQRKVILTVLGLNIFQLIIEDDLVGIIGPAITVANQGYYYFAMLPRLHLAVP